MVGERGEESLEERVKRLEKDTEEVRDELRRLNGRLDRALSGQDEVADRDETALSSSGDHPIVGKSAPGSSSNERSFGLPWNLGDLGDFRSGEWWLNKIGIGLLLFGVAFLYLLSVERGWIGPPVRVGFGLAVSATLLVMGLRLYEDRRAFARVLLGGGIGAFYITGFAAFQFYALVPYPVAFGFMVAVTLLAFYFSVRQNTASLSLIGSLGGLATPFILYNGSGTPGGLVLYACLILAGTGAIYLYKGWVSLLGTSFAGGWMVFLIGLAGVFSFWARAWEDQLFLQLGVSFTWLLFWLAPVVREVLRSRSSAAWPLPVPGPLARSLFGENGGVLRGSVPAHLTSVVTPLIALALTQGIWSFQKETLGWIALGGAALYALAALVVGRLERGRGVRVAHTQALVALLLLTLTFLLVLEGNALLFTLAAEAAVLHLVAHRLPDRAISVGAHCLFLVAATWLGIRLASGILGGIEGFYPALDVRPAVFNVTALTDLAIIALGFGVSGFVLPRGSGRVYRLTAHAALLAWLWRELSALPGGDAYVTIAWGLYAVGLFVVGLRLDRVALVRGGMAIFFLVVGKLFLVDLAQVGTVWRVLLFLGFGGLFLALSYYLRLLWRPGATERGARRRRGERAFRARAQTALPADDVVVEERDRA